MKTEKSKYGYRGLYSYRQWVRVIRLFPNNFYVLFLPVERVCKRFWKETWRVQVAHLHKEARALSSPSRLSTNLGKDFFRYLWYCGKKQIECGLTWHYWWLGSTDLGLINWHVFEKSECRNCCLYIIIQKIAPQAEYGKFFQIWFLPRFGRKKWRRSEHAHASYPGLFFRPPGFSPYKGREERRVQELDYP